MRSVGAAPSTGSFCTKSENQRAWVHTASSSSQYVRSVVREGNRLARQVVKEVFDVCDRTWRGVGPIAASGYRLRPEYAPFDAVARFDVGSVTAFESPECIAGTILRGRAKPPNCTAFGGRCTPDHPLGAPMVSSEGACAAYFQYGRAL